MMLPKNVAGLGGAGSTAVAVGRGRRHPTGTADAGRASSLPLAAAPSCRRQPELDGHR